MGLDLTLLAETILKLVIFLPIMGLIGWWLFSAWFVDRALTAEEFVGGSVLLFLAFMFGVKTILLGGWGFFGILALVYLALLTLAIGEYVQWRRVELKHLHDELARYQRAIALDPTAIGAYSLLGATHLKLSQFEEAAAVLEKAVELDPESKQDRRLLERARRREGGPARWWRG